MTMQGEKKNWIGEVSGYGAIGFWECTKEEATEALRDKAAWEGGRFSIREARETEEDNSLLAPGRAGCYDVGERPKAGAR